VLFDLNPSPPSGDRLNLIVTDLGELLEAHHQRDRAERVSRSKDEFLATFAHELRNPPSAPSPIQHWIGASPRAPSRCGSSATSFGSSKC